MPPTEIPFPVSPFADGVQGSKYSIESVRGVGKRDGRGWRATWLPPFMDSDRSALQAIEAGRIPPYVSQMYEALCSHMQELVGYWHRADAASMARISREQTSSGWEANARAVQVVSTQSGVRRSAYRRARAAANAAIEQYEERCRAYEHAFVQAHGKAKGLEVVVPTAVLPIEIAEADPPE